MMTQSFQSDDSIKLTQSIREKFEKDEYNIDYLPMVLSAENGEVFRHEDVPYPDVATEQEHRKNGLASKANVPVPQLKAISAGDWTFCLSMVQTNFFHSRDRFEEQVIPMNLRTGNPRCIHADKISIREAMKKMDVEMAANMDYYRKNMSELDADLGRQVSSTLNINDNLLLRTLEQELFYRLMCRILGAEIEDDTVEADGERMLWNRSFMLRDFNILSYDGNNMMATAIRENSYFVFQFDTS